jgi:organic hydroperoxide reductase OsmC/OhrA
MSKKTHEYQAFVVWTGNKGTGTSNYGAYGRTWELRTPGKPVLACSNDPNLGGDPQKYNPEDMLVAALSSCHMLWYLHLCAVAGVTVTAYEDAPVGAMAMNRDGSGQFETVALHPKVTVAATSDADKARQLHGEVHKYCFIARSVNFPVVSQPEIIVGK